MKPARLFIAGGLLALFVVVLWQVRAIAELRKEVASLRNDLRTVVERELTTAGKSTDPARVEKLELIKLRHDVRELKESGVDARAQGSQSGVGAAIKALVATPANSGPLTIQNDWRGMEASLTNQYVEAIKTVERATDEYVRFLSTGRAAKLSLAVGRTNEAGQFARDMLVLDDKFSRGVAEKRNGDVVHDANLVLGRIALAEGRVEDAKKHLLAAGKTSGSPSLSSFGPNMSLARDLLLRNEPGAVLEYFESCRKFWSLGGEKLDEWTKDIEAGRLPEFGANLIY